LTLTKNANYADFANSANFASLANIPNFTHFAWFAEFLMSGTDKQYPTFPAEGEMTQPCLNHLK
jgi:hypothetical protein